MLFGPYSACFSLPSFTHSHVMSCSLGLQTGSILLHHWRCGGMRSELRDALGNWSPFSNCWILASATQVQHLLQAAWQWHNLTILKLRQWSIMAHDPSVGGNSGSTTWFNCDWSKLLLAGACTGSEGGLSKALTCYEMSRAVALQSLKKRGCWEPPLVPALLGCLSAGHSTMRCDNEEGPLPKVR